MTKLLSLLWLESAWSNGQDTKLYFLLVLGWFCLLLCYFFLLALDCFCLLLLANVCSRLLAFRVSPQDETGLIWVKFPLVYGRSCVKNEEKIQIRRREKNAHERTRKKSKANNYLQKSFCDMTSFFSRLQYIFSFFPCLLPRPKASYGETKSSTSLFFNKNKYINKINENKTKHRITREILLNGTL